MLQRAKSIYVAEDGGLKTNKPPTLIRSLTEPETSFFDQSIDELVQRQISKYNYTPRRACAAPPLKTHPIPESITKLEGVLMINNTPTSPNDLVSISTPGGGTCLIHAFLTTLSPSYRSLSAEDRNTIGERFRSYLAKEPGFEEEEYQELRAINRNHPKNPIAGSYYSNLSMQIGLKIARFLKVNLIYLTVNGLDYPNDLNPDLPIVMLLQTTGHFEAIRLPHMDKSAREAFIQSLPDIIIPVADEVFDQEYTTEEIQNMKDVLLGMGVQEGDMPTTHHVVQIYNNFMNGGKRMKKKNRTKKNNKNHKKKKNTKKHKKKKKNTKKYLKK
jgi:hypothetical protein